MSLPKMVIEVLPLPDDHRWGVFVGVGTYVLLMGISKSSCDCDFAAERLAKGFTDIHEDPNEPVSAGAMKEFLMLDHSDVGVFHHPEDRERLQKQQDENKKKAKKDAKDRNSA